MESSGLVDTTERVIYLRSLPVAAGLAPEVLRILATYMYERTYTAGERLLSEGEPLGVLRLLTAGCVCLRRQGREVGRLRPPQTLGFLGILAHGQSPFDALVETEVRLLELRADVLLELMEDHFSLAQASIRYCSERLLSELFELPADALRIPFSDTPMPAGALDLVDRILHFRSLRVYQHANMNALAVLSRMAIERRFVDGERLWSAGESSDALLTIVSGRVTCSTPDGRTFQYGPSTVIGGVEALAGKPHWYDAVSAGPLLALEQNIGEMLDVYEENFALARSFLATIAVALQEILDRRMALGQSSIEVRREVSALGLVPVGA